MFCKYCGTQINDTAKFCPKCGKETSIKEEVEQKEDNEIKLKIKPVFIVPYKLLNNVMIIVFMILVAVIGLKDVLFETQIIEPLYIVIVILLIVIIYVTIKMLLEKRQYKDLEYTFYKTKVEYKDGFLTKEEKELKYKYVREVLLTQGILERLFGIGTIRIFTNASSGTYNRNNYENVPGRNGIYIHCVENVEEQYQKIKKIINEGTEE